MKKLNVNPQAEEWYERLGVSQARYTQLNEQQAVDFMLIVRHDLLRQPVFDEIATTAHRHAKTPEEAYVMIIHSINRLFEIRAMNDLMKEQTAQLRLEESLRSDAEFVQFLADKNIVKRAKDELHEEGK